MLTEEKEQKQERKEKSRRAPRVYSNGMIVCIRKEEQGEPEGEIIHLNLQKPIPYRGMAELGFRIDEIARFLGLPESSRRGRASRTGPDVREESPPEIRRRRLSSGRERRKEFQALPEEFGQIVPTEQWRQEDFTGRFPEKGIRKVIYVELLGRECHSLQGRIRCRGRRKPYVYFRSVLELMHLFAELLQDGEGGSHTPNPEQPAHREEAEVLQGYPLR